MKRIQFNTGRLYQADGQRITAVEDDEGHVFFCDHSRMIDGRLTNNPFLTETAVLSQYDKGHYELYPIPQPVRDLLEWQEPETPVQILNRYTDQIEDLRNDMLFDEDLEIDGIAEMKFLQALSLLEQAHHVMKEAISSEVTRHTHFIGFRGEEY